MCNNIKENIYIGYLVLTIVGISTFGYYFSSNNFFLDNNNKKNDHEKNLVKNNIFDQQKYHSIYVNQNGFDIDSRKKYKLINNESEILKSETINNESEILKSETINNESEILKEDNLNICRIENKYEIIDNNDYEFDWLLIDN